MAITLAPPIPAAEAPPTPPAVVAVVVASPPLQGGEERTVRGAPSTNELRGRILGNVFIKASTWRTNQYQCKSLNSLNVFVGVCVCLHTAGLREEGAGPEGGANLSPV